MACQVGAIPGDERERWLDVGKRFYASVEEIEELISLDVAARAGFAVSGRENVALEGVEALATQLRHD